MGLARLHGGNGLAPAPATFAGAFLWESSRGDRDSKILCGDCPTAVICDHTVCMCQYSTVETLLN